MYTYEIKGKLAKKLTKIARKDSAHYAEITNKILQIAENPSLASHFAMYSKVKEEFMLDHLF